MGNLEYAGISIIAIIMALNELLKGLGVNEKYIPIFSVIFGLVAGMLLFSIGNIKEGVVLGLYIGLSAVGLYSGTKNVVEGIKK